MEQYAEDEEVLEFEILGLNTAQRELTDEHMMTATAYIFNVPNEVQCEA